jgi:hypothetical protein
MLAVENSIIFTIIAGVLTFTIIALTIALPSSGEEFASRDVGTAAIAVPCR